MSGFKGTKGKWVYSPDRHTHDSIIHSEHYKEEFGYISGENGGVVGSSEWIWINKYDAQLISCAPEMFEELKAKYAYLEKLAVRVPSEYWTEEFRDEWNKEMRKLEQLIKKATKI